MEASSNTKFDVESIRRDFPILQTTVYGKPLVYLDSAASAQKPLYVIKKMEELYTTLYSNVHRGIHSLSQKSTDAFEEARVKVKNFINASSLKEIIFVKGATEGINLVAQSYLRPRLQAGDEILISIMEHHANIVPWQMVCEQTGAKLSLIPMNEKGELILDNLDDLLTSKTKLVSIAHISNVLGTINPVEKIIEKANKKNIPVLIDGAQSIVHQRIDIQKLNCDFFVFSGHKLYGPTGIGVLFGKEKILETMPPYQGGGDMIRSVSFEKTTYNDIPHKFEAGTPPIAEAVGLAAAIDYLSAIPWEGVRRHEDSLLKEATRLLGALPHVRLIGTAEKKAGVLSFVIDGVHPHDIGTLLDHEGIAIRVGQHCAEPLMHFLKIPATARASFALYNTLDEVRALEKGVREVLNFFKGENL